ncbi:hypothetical protein ACFL2H_05715 [Planctomycetota bacterium]
MTRENAIHATEKGNVNELCLAESGARVPTAESERTNGGPSRVEGEAGGDDREVPHRTIAAPSE